MQSVSFFSVTFGMTDATHSTRQPEKLEVNVSDALPEAHPN